MKSAPSSCVLSNSSKALQIANGSPIILLLVTSFLPEEFRIYQNILSRYGELKLHAATNGAILEKSPQLVIIPDRLINMESSVENDTLLDEFFLSNQLYKQSPHCLYLGKSGLSQIKKIGHSFDILSPPLNKSKKFMFQAQITEKGRELLQIPDEVLDKTFVNLENIRLPRRICIPDDAIILATVKQNAIEYVAAYYSPHDKVLCDFTNPIQWNKEGGFVNSHTGMSYGNLLTHYYLSFMSKLP